MERCYRVVSCVGAVYQALIEAEVRVLGSKKQHGSKVSTVVVDGRLRGRRLVDECVSAPTLRADQWVLSGMEH